MPAVEAVADLRIWRILRASDLPRLMDGAHHPEGRFHHDGQPAFYCSPSPQAAGHAVAPYLRPGDGPRLLVPLRLTVAGLCDLRDPATLARLGLAGDETAVPWRPQRAAGLPATTWRASDAVRASGAPGMIYTARSAPDRWHLVLFAWNAGPGSAALAPAGPPRPFIAPG
ncbi:RES family NAD+ phosphorylase [Rhodobacter sp. Har01]|uniref:RES family NAD+ phosphorylase n=1 Tax=Rhodobacter sp. Har01 TaxID=2883999 RepID=UPI001D0813E3|nr:RES family NAD+ phosphorylase [Rhodobacter sp. Har01]MCB6179218.1 RES family NAD+ phosphorylase [Rhodobacter sp. Har01]